jgi:hypothetical protein
MDSLLKAPLLGKLEGKLFTETDFPIFPNNPCLFARKKTESSLID